MECPPLEQLRPLVAEELMLREKLRGHILVAQREMDALKKGRRNEALEQMLMPTIFQVGHNRRARQIFQKVYGFNTYSTVECTE